MANTPVPPVHCVTRGEVALLVHSFLTSGGFTRSAHAFAEESRALTQKIEGSRTHLKSLTYILDEYVQLKQWREDREREAQKEWLRTHTQAAKIYIPEK